MGLVPDLASLVTKGGVVGVGRIDLVLILCGIHGVGLITREDGGDRRYDKGENEQVDSASMSNTLQLHPERMIYRT